MCRFRKRAWFWRKRAWCWRKRAWRGAIVKVARGNTTHIGSEHIVSGSRDKKLSDFFPNLKKKIQG